MSRRKTSDKCVYKRAHAQAFDSCYICNGYDMNCPTYEFQMSKEEEYSDD